MDLIPDDQDELLREVRKTINDNKNFLDRLLDEDIDVPDDEDAGEQQPLPDEEFEEL